jgi:hypothetical protein
MWRIFQYLLAIAISPLLLPQSLLAEKILIPMDHTQKNHLKAYGLAYRALQSSIPVEWLLNYRGGSFLLPVDEGISGQALIDNISAEIISDQKVLGIYAEIDREENNLAIMKLEKAPKIVVYVPPANMPWDDAVTLVLSYADIPYEKIWDKEVLNGKLMEYDWLHVHHEDFTGQYGKFYSAFRHAPWYMRQKRQAEQLAAKLGFKKVSEEKKAVARKIKAFVGQGGFMFAMCSAPDSYDIALAAENLDIVPEEFDGDGIDQNVQSKLNYDETFAFENFELELNPFKYKKSNIDISPHMTGSAITEANDYFMLFEFSAKYDPVPTMLTQCHTNLIKNFYGQTTSFNKDLIKSSVVIMGEKKSSKEVKYIHGNYGKGQFCFYGGHDPEDYQHMVGEPPTDLELHKNSPGYRLILNNVLFPAAQKKKQKT